MRIAISGTQCVGKSTLIEDMLKVWPNYKKTERSYRDLAKSKNVKLNKLGNKEGQQLILNDLCDQVMKYKKTDNVLFDRCVFDNLVYSIWLNAKGTSDLDDTFIEKSILLAKEASKFYDIIFFVPVLEEYPVEIVPDENRDTDPVFRSEIDVLMKELYGTYHQKKGPFFDFSDCPAIIEVFGSREERINMIKLYLDEAGVVPEKSLLDS